jgi:predicted metal-dependent hydrolase
MASNDDLQKLYDLLFDAVSISKQEVRQSLPPGRRWQANSTFIENTLKVLDSRLANDHSLMSIDGAPEIAHDLISEQLRATINNNRLINDLLDEMRNVYVEEEKAHDN